MTFWKKLAHLVPSIRRASERDMRDELESLHEIAGPGVLGNLALAAEDARAEMSWGSLERLMQDVRYGLRSMARDKLFAAAAIVSLALGIGANTAIYSFLDSVILRPLPVADPDRLVIMKWRAKNYTLSSKAITWSTDGSWSSPSGTISSSFPYPVLKLFEHRPDVLVAAFAYFVNDVLSVTVGNNTDSLIGHYVSGQYFQGMGVAPRAGRLIQPADDDPAAAAVAVVSERFGAGRFGDARAAIGQSIRVNDRPVLVVGVVPSSFFGAEPGAIPDIYLPLHASEMFVGKEAEDHWYWLDVMGRLRPGMTLAQAQARLAPAFHQYVAATAQNERQTQDLPELQLEAGATGLDGLRRKYALPIYVLMTMVGLMLLIACANIANLLLARSAARRREIAIRLSVGANRWRVIRQLLTESVLLSAIGGTLGLALAWWGIRVLTALLANGRANFTVHAQLDWRVLVVTVTLVVLTGLFFGLAPAVQATRVDIAPALKDGGAPDAPRRSRRLIGAILVVTQMALSLLLLVAAGLFDRTIASLHDIPLGFNRENVLLFTIRPYTVGYQGSASLRLYEGLRKRLRQLPGVGDVGISIRPLPMGGGTSALVEIVGAAPAATPPHAVLGSVGPDFFKTMQIPIVAGREFTDRDDAVAPHVAVVNRRFATAFGVPNPVGRILVLGAYRYEIVGLAENALTMTLKEQSRPAIYFSYLQAQRAPAEMTYEIRTVRDPLNIAASVRAIVRDADSRIAVYDVTTEAEYIDQAISTEITLARLCSTFAAIALVIACVGLYGTVSFNVARRTQEIGIRSALGATDARLVWMVLRDVVLMAGVGLVFGLPLVLAGSRYVKAFLFGIAPDDPVAIGLAMGMLVAAALGAGYLPARRAARIDPLLAIRSE